MTLLDTPRGTRAYGCNTLRRRRVEARLLAATPAPRLAPACECGASPASLLNEYVPDITLEDLAAIAPLPAAAALHALRDVAGILHAMHECELVHGDLRPSAVYVLPDGRAALSQPLDVPPAAGTTHEAAWQGDAVGFAMLALELLTGVRPRKHRHAVTMTRTLPVLPAPAAAALRQALTAEPADRPLPLQLVEALEAVPAEDWPSNHLGRTPRATTAPPTAPTRPISRRDGSATTEPPPAPPTTPTRPISRRDGSATTEPPPAPDLRRPDPADAARWAPPADPVTAPSPDQENAADERSEEGKKDETQEAGEESPAEPDHPAAADGEPLETSPPPPPGPTATPTARPSGVVVRIVPRRRVKSRLRRIFETSVILLGLATVLTGGGTGAWLLFSTPAASAGDQDAAPVAVHRIALGVTPPQAHCPHAAFHITAAIITDGAAGTFELRWRLPHGGTADAQRFRVDEGETVVHTAIDLVLTGRRQVLGDVVAVVTPGGSRSRLPLRYLCPSAEESRPARSRAA